MKKVNNNILFLVLVALLGTFVATKIFRSPRLESNVRKDLVAIDSGAISKVEIAPSNSAQEILLLREGNTWMVQRAAKKHKADNSTVRSVLGMMQNVQAERMISRKKEKWEEFNVGDKGTRITFYAGTNKKGTIHIGKTGFSNTGSMYGGTGYNYVRLAGENEVYRVNEFLESAFNRPFDDWRDKTFLRVPKNKVTRIAFNYPADSSFILEKRDSVWVVGNQVAEKSKVENFLGQLSYKNLNKFLDDFTPAKPADVMIVIEGEGGTLSTVEAWSTDNGWALRASQQNDVVFSSSTSGVERDLLVGAKHFIDKRT